MSNSSPKTAIQKALDAIAAESGMAVIVVDRESEVVASSNDNSICRALTHSAEFAPKCAEFCGKAFERAAEAGGPIDYECHAGLQCRAVPLNRGRSMLVAITGRTFMKADNYRAATARAISGDWTVFPPATIFDNVILS